MDRNKKIDFIVALGASYHHFGASAYRVEVALTNLSKVMDLEAQFFFTPTYLMSAFKTEDGETSRHVRVEPVDIAFDKLCQVDEVGNSVASGELSVHEAMRRLKEIEETKDNYHPLIKIISTGIVASSISILFKPELENAGASFFVGLCVGVVKYFSLRKESNRSTSSLKNFFEFLAAFVAAICSYSICLHFPKVDLFVSILSGLIVLIPGLSFTTAVAELARNHLASGTARMMGAFVGLIKFALGVAMGVTFMKSFGELPVLRPGIVVGDISVFNCIIITCLAVTILFEARPKDSAWIVLAGITGVYSAKLGELLISNELSTFIGGLVVGFGANLFARKFRRPASLFLIPGIILLVPGSLGYKSLSFLLEKNTLAGIETAFSMLAVGLSLVTGLLLGHLLIDPKRSL